MAVDLGKLLVRIGVDNKRLFTGLMASERRLKSFGSRIKRMATGMGALMGVAGAAALAIKMIGVGSSFAKEMAIVKGVALATERDAVKLESRFRALEKVARDLGATTEWTAGQAAQGLKFLAMAGFDAEKSIKALPGVLDLATAGNIELGRAADIATNALTAMRLPVEELGRVSDVMVRTITTSNTNMEMLAESFKYAAPLASAFGYEVETLSALIGLLGNAGIQGSMAGTQLAMSFVKVDKAFKAYGVSTTRADGSTKDLVDALEMLTERGATAMEVMKIFGQRSGRAALALMGQGVPAIRAYIKEINEAEGATKDLATIMRDTLVGDLKTLQSAMEDLAIEVFKEYEDVLRSNIQWATMWVRTHKRDVVEAIESTYNALSKIVAVAKAIPSGAIGAGVILYIVGRAGPIGKTAAALYLLNVQLEGHNERMRAVIKGPHAMFALGIEKIGIGLKNTIKYGVGWTAFLGSLSSDSKKYVQALKLANADIDVETAKFMMLREPITGVAPPPVPFTLTPKADARQKEMEQMAKNIPQLKKVTEALQAMSKVILELSTRKLEFAGAEFGEALRENADSLEGMRGALKSYLSTVDETLGQQLDLQMKVTKGMERAYSQQEDIAKQAKVVAETEIKLVETRLAAWEQYYSALSRAHSKALDDMSKKTKEYAAFEASMQAQWQGYADLELALKQKLMSAEEQYRSTQEDLEAKFAIASALSGKEKIAALTEWQRAAANVAKEVKDGDIVIISLTEAVERALVQVVDAQKLIATESDIVKLAMKEEMASVQGFINSLETAMAKAKEMLEHYKNELVKLDSALMLNRTLSVETGAALTGIQRVQQALDEIQSKTVTLTVMVNQVGGVVGGGGGLPEYHTGGLATDECLAVVQAGEYIVNKKSTEKYRGAIEQINADTFHEGGEVGRGEGGRGGWTGDLIIHTASSIEAIERFQEEVADSIKRGASPIMDAVEERMDGEGR